MGSTLSTPYYTTYASIDMSADSPRRTIRGVPAVVPPQVVNDRSIIDSVAGFINDVTLTNQLQCDPKDTITWARFETTADISDPTFGDDWEIDSNATPPLLLILGYGLGIQVWAIPANGEAIEVLSWRHGNVTALRILPTPFSADDGLTQEGIDIFADKRPLMAICDGATSQTGLLGQQQQPPHCSVNFISLKSGQQIKTIKFKNNVLDILANRTSVVIIFPERIAVFDARTLEDRLSITSCFPSPGINPNPIALGSRWLAYSESKLLHTKRSGGGCHADGVSSYTATVLNAAKSFGKGLRELGEQMAAGLTGTTSSSGISSKSSSIDPITGDIKQPGVITILDIKHPIKNLSPTSGTPITVNGSDPIVAHFIAHSDAIVAMEFDYSGMLLLTADKRGHDFHLFRIQPHPAGSHLAAVHHLYILHRGDTSAKVQNISFSMDSRWVAVSTLRGTTHVFPITPYGGSYGVRTHASLHVVNKLSRFHRSAGLSADNRSSSPISHSDSMSFNNQFCMPYNNPTMPPFPRPHIILPLAQLRQPTVLGSPPGSAHNLSYQKSSISSSSAAAAAAAGRQRLSSLSDDNGKPLSVCAIFAKARSWLLIPPNSARDGPGHKHQRKAVDSLFIMAGHGALIQYDLDTKLASNVAREKICDDTPIELDVEAKAQWNLRRNECSIEIQPPLCSDNLLIKEHYSKENLSHNLEENDERNDIKDRWLSQVEIITHAGPHRRLWMGPQFVFKTYNTPSGSNLSHIDAEAVEIGVTSGTGTGVSNIVKPGRSSPMNMPLTSAGRSAVPVLIESGSYSSIEQSPKLMDRFKHDHLDSDFTMNHGDSRLKEDLADAMRESPSVQHKDTGIKPTTICLLNKSRQYTTKTTSATQLYSGLNYEYQSSPISPLVYNDNNCDQYLSAYSDPEPSPPTTEIISQLNEPAATNERSTILIEKVVNPLGIVTTITRSPSDNDIDVDNPYGGDYDPDDYIIHENCDESLFRPVVTIFCNDPQYDSSGRFYDGSQINNTTNMINEEPPELISAKIIVPVIEKQNIIKNEQTLEKFTKTISDLNMDDSYINKNVEQPKINKKSKNLHKKINKIEQIKGNAEISSLENLSYSVKNTESLSKITDNKSSYKSLVDEAPKKYKSNLRKSENVDPKKSTNKNSEQRNSISVNKEEIQIKIEKENLDDVSSYLKETENDDNKNFKLPVNLNQKNEIKPHKDEDSESFESLENIEVNIDFDSEKSPNKSLGSPDEFEIIDQKNSPIKKDIKLQSEEIKIDLPSEEIITTVKNELQINLKSSNDIKTLKKQKVTGKQSDNIVEYKIEKSANKEIPEFVELEFYDKFAKDEIKDVKTSTTKDSTQIKVDFPILGNNKLNKKQKYENSNKYNIPTNSFSLTSNNYETIDEPQITNNRKNNKKPEENTSITENVETTVTFTLPMKKKSNKRSPIKDFIPNVKDDDSRNIISSKSGKSLSISRTNKQSSTLNTKELLNKLDFETIQTSNNSVGDGKIDVDDFALPPLSPLQPFETKFDKAFELQDDRNIGDHFSLINFESPVQEDKKNSRNINQTNRKLSNESFKDIKESGNNDSTPEKIKGYPENNIIFALCGSLHYENENSKSLSSSDINIQETKQDELKKSIDDYDDQQQDYYKNLEPIKNISRTNKIHQQRRHSRDDKLKVHPNNTTPSTPSSSSDTEESSATISFKLIKNHQEKTNEKLLNLTQNNDDVYDEELRPLISACSLISSISGTSASPIINTDNKKSKKSTINCNESSSKNPSNLDPISTNLTLPPKLNIKNSTKLQSSGDSSSDQANNTSEEQGGDSDEQQPIILNPSPTDNSNFKLITDIPQQLNDNSTTTDIINSSGGTVGGGVGGNSNNAQQQQNGKKKSKRKKR